jgi:hypothetical protein
VDVAAPCGGCAPGGDLRREFLEDDTEVSGTFAAVRSMSTELTGITGMECMYAREKTYQGYNL